MSERRKGESLQTRSRFRSDRMFQEGNKWYFQTREGTMEGPYRDRMEAARMLDAYMDVMQSCFTPGQGLSLQPEGTAHNSKPAAAQRPAQPRRKSQISPFSLEPLGD